MFALRTRSVSRYLAIACMTSKYARQTYLCTNHMLTAANQRCSNRINCTAIKSSGRCFHRTHWSSSNAEVRNTLNSFTADNLHVYHFQQFEIDAYKYNSKLTAALNNKRICDERDAFWNLRRKDGNFTLRNILTDLSVCQTDARCSIIQPECTRTSFHFVLSVRSPTTVFPAECKGALKSYRNISSNLQYLLKCQKCCLTRNNTEAGYNKLHLCRGQINSCMNVSIRLYCTSNQRRDKGEHSFPTRLKPPWRILFFGTDEIAQHTLKELYLDMNTKATLVESLEVVTVKEQRAVRMFAESVDLPVSGWPIKVEHGKYDVGVLVSFGHLIPDAVIHMFPYGILNMHPSLLPRWRGASPVIHTILNGDEETGVSIMDIRPKHFDIGPVLLQRSFQVPHRCTSFQLADIAGRFGADTVLECLQDLPTLERFEREQATRGITYAHKIKHVNANIDWENQTAHQVDCQYRAIAELMPLKTEYEGHVVKLLDVVDPNILKGLSSKELRGYQGDITLSSPGTVAYHRNVQCLVVKCKEGFIGFHGLVLKRKLSALDFYNGYLNTKTQSKFTSLNNDLNKYIQMERIPAKMKA